VGSERELQTRSLQGYWFDRTQEYAARRRQEDFDRLRYATLETLHLFSLPCWQHLPDAEWRKRVLSLIMEIEEQAAARRSRTGRDVSRKGRPPSAANISMIVPRGPSALPRLQRRADRGRLRAGRGSGSKAMGSLSPSTNRQAVRHERRSELKGV